MYASWRRLVTQWKDHRGLGHENQLEQATIRESLRISRLDISQRGYAGVVLAGTTTTTRTLDARLQ